MRFPVKFTISIWVLLLKINTMTATFNTTSFLLLSLVLGLVSCNNENKLSPPGDGETKEQKTEKLEIRSINKNSLGFISKYEGDKEALGNNENNYAVHGTDELGNKVFGSVNIEGKIGIGIITGIEYKSREIVVEQTGIHLLIGTDVKGCEYKLTIDDK